MKKKIGNRKDVKMRLNSISTKPSYKKLLIAATIKEFSDRIKSKFNKI